MARKQKQQDRCATEGCHSGRYLGLEQHCYWCLCKIHKVDKHHGHPAVVNTALRKALAKSKRRTIKKGKSNAKVSR